MMLKGKTQSSMMREWLEDQCHGVVFFVRRAMGN
jgi:hypothetical protein